MRARNRAAIRWALSPVVSRQALLVALIVGTLLNLINQGDILLEGGEISWLKLVSTYAVPYLVATYGAFVAVRSNSVGSASGTDQDEIGTEDP